MREDYDHIRELANKDVDVLMKKNEEYGASWRKRGGTGAFMMLARKWDRIETQVEKMDYNIFSVIKKDKGPTGILDDIRDLRAYLLLVESHLTAPTTAVGQKESLKQNVIYKADEPVSITSHGQLKE